RHKLTTQRQKVAAEAQELARGQADVEEERAILEEERAQLEDERQTLERARNGRQAESDSSNSGIPPEFLSQPTPPMDPYAPQQTPGEELYDHFHPQQEHSQQESVSAELDADPLLDRTNCEPANQLERPTSNPSGDDGDLLSMFDQCADEIESETAEEVTAAEHPDSRDDQPSSESLQSDPKDPFGLGNEPDSEASELREKLADMFGIEADKTESADEVDDQSPAQQPPADEECDGLLTSMMDSLTAETPEEKAEAGDSQLTEAVQSESPAIDSAEISITPNETADSEESADSATEGESGKDDSISTYMEELLARSRKSSGATAPVAKQPEAQPVNECHETQPVDPQESATIEGNATERPPRNIPLGEIAPAHSLDKDATRADMRSLRELANLSARTALATHATKEMRGKMFVSSLLTVVAFTVAAVLFTGKLWGPMSYEATGWAAALVGVIMAAELMRSTLLVHRVKSTGQIADLDHSPQAQRLPAANETTVEMQSDQPRQNAEPIEIDAFVIDDDEADADIIDDVVVG
ncbi:MAG: hypothetical protein HOK71_21575, partial [Planctomycetaceae bacterium]|nr:hypothetical protein [Planctomycetaceae bacterium]